MKLLLVHNYYQRPGGEESIFHNEIKLLEEYGHDVVTFTKHNDTIDDQSKIITALETFWSFRTYKEMIHVLEKEDPDVVYFFNTFPLISPSAYYACKRKNVPVIQVLANPRYMCPTSTLNRDGKLCLDCVGKFVAWPGIRYRCYHNSFVHSAVVAAMIAFHKLIRTWDRKVDGYFVATKFYVDLYAKAGLPESKLLYKPHFSLDRNLYTNTNGNGYGEYALFVGRLDPEKGVSTLLEAWKDLDIPLKIRGEGLLSDWVEEFIQENVCTHIELVERKSFHELLELMKNARFLVWPSEGYYETFGMVAIESFSMGVPVLASDIGVMSEIVEDEETGRLFTAGDPYDLARQAIWMWNNPHETRRMGKMGRKKFEDEFSPSENYKHLIKLLKLVIEKNAESET